MMQQQQQLDANEFLEVISDNIATKGAQLHSGELALTLNPRCIVFLQELMSGYERDGTFPPDINMSHRELVGIYSFFLRLPALLVCPTVRGVADGKMDLSVFVGLTSLQLVDLVGGVEVPSVLRARLQQLTIRGMLDEAGDILGRSDEKDKEWSCLKRLDLGSNFLKDLNGCCVNDTLTSLTSLNLSHNLFVEVPALEQCIDLQRLNLSFNKITDVTVIQSRIGGVVNLSLQGNKLVSTAGLQFLMGLSHLDLRDNRITDWEDVRLLRRLPFLQQLWLKGNPLFDSPTYRIDVFRRILLHNETRQSPVLTLDGIGTSKAELDDLALLERETPSAVDDIPSTGTSPVKSGGSALYSRRKKRGPVVTVEAAVPKGKLAPPKVESVSPVADFSDVVEDDDEFAQKVKSLKSEFGSKWLIMLEGMERERDVSPTRSPREHGSLKEQGKRATKKLSSDDAAPKILRKSADASSAPRKSPEKRKTVMKKSSEAVVIEGGKRAMKTSSEIVLPDASSAKPFKTSSDTALVEADKRASGSKIGRRSDAAVVTKAEEQPNKASPVVAVTMEEEILEVVRSVPVIEAALEEMAASEVEKEKEEEEERERELERLEAKKKLDVAPATTLPDFSLSPDKPVPSLSQESRLVLSKSGVKEFVSGLSSKYGDVEQEFLVLRQNSETAAFDLQRILLFHTTHLVEADVDKGDTVVALELSNLTKVETIDFGEGEGPVVKLVFVAKVVGETKSIYAWRMLDKEDATKLVTLCKRQLDKNGVGVAYSSMQCMRCDHVFPNPSKDSMDVSCPQCESHFVVTVNTNKEASSSSPSTPRGQGTVASAEAEKSPLKTSTTSLQQSLDFLYKRDFEHGLDVFIKLKILVESATEEVLCLLKCDAAVWVDRGETEKPQVVLVSSKRIYLLASASADSSNYESLAVVSSFLWSSFCRITIGLFMSWIRFDAAQAGQQHVLIQNVSHLKIHRLSDVVRAVCPKLALHHVGRLTVTGLKQSIIGAGAELALYSRVRLRKKSRRTVLFTVGSEVVHKSLVVSNDVVVLCDEDIGRWFVHMGGTPSFSDVAKYRISDVASIFHDGDASAVVEFDSEVKNLTWPLEFASPQEKLRCLDVLSNRWSAELGGIHLPERFN